MRRERNIKQKGERTRERGKRGIQTFFTAFVLFHLVPVAAAVAVAAADVDVDVDVAVVAFGAVTWCTLNCSGDCGSSANRSNVKWTQRITSQNGQSE